MKKLIALIGAAALGFAAFADGVVSPLLNKVENFEGFAVGDKITNGTSYVEEGTVIRPWSLAADADEESATIAEESEGGNKYVALETDASKGLLRAINNRQASTDPLTAADIDTGIFMDAKVKFTCAEEAAAIGEGTKLCIWAQQIEADDTVEPAVVAATNLIVTAGQVNNDTFAVTPTNFVLAVADNFDFAAWHRVTVRAIKDVTADSGVVGFVVFIDGEQVAAVADGYADKVGLSDSQMTSEAKKFYAAQQLFLSCVSSEDPSAQQLTYLGFAGSGAADNIAIYNYDGAKEDLKFAVGQITFSLKYKSVVQRFVCKVGGVVVPADAIVKTDDGCDITLDGSVDELVISDIVVAAGSKVTNYDTDATTITFTGDLTTGGEIETETIVAIIDGVEYTDFAKALKDAADSSKTLELASNFTWLMTGSESTIMISKNMTIDLAGKTFTLSDPDGNDYPGFDLYANLTIIDTVGGGAIVDLEGEMTQAIYPEAGQLIIGSSDDEGPTIDCVIAYDDDPEMAANVDIIRGSINKHFNSALSGDGWNMVDEESEIASVTDDYFVVAPKAAPVATPFAIIIAGEVYKYYNTLQAAINAYEGEGEVVVLESCTLDSEIAIANDAIVNFSNNVVTAAKNADNDAIWVKAGATVTLKNGKLVDNNQNVAIYNSGDLTIASDFEVVANNRSGIMAIAGSGSQTKAKLTVYGKVSALGTDGNDTWNAICGHGNDKVGADIIIGEGAQLISKGNGIYFPGAGTLTVNGGVIQGYEYGIYAKSGTVTVTGGEISSLAEAVVDPSVDGSGTNGAGHAMVVESGADAQGYADNLTFEVSGGKFTSVGAAIVNFVQDGADPIAAGITGGIFKAQPDVALIALADGQDTAKWVTDEDGYYVPVSFLAVAQVGDVKYATLQEALNVGGNVKVLQDITVDSMFTVVGTVVLDLNSKTITNTNTRQSGLGKVIAVSEGASLTIDGGSLVSEHDSAIQNKGTLVVNGGSYTGTEGAVFFLGGSVTTIEGGTFTASDNAVIIGQGLAENGNCTLTINDGTFNGGIVSPGYIACGIYIPNSGTYTINGGTFNIVKGCGICARAGETVVNGGTWNLTGDLTATGKVGDKATLIACKTFVFDDSNPPYPGYVSETDGIGVPAVVETEINTIKSTVDFSDALVGDDYEVVGPDKDGYYSVAQSEPAVAVAKVDGVEYTDLHDALEAGKAEGSVVELIADVDLKNEPWTPIDGFAGTFDGKGYTISNLKIEAADNNVGFIGSISGQPLIKDVTFDGANVKATSGTKHAIVVGCDPADGHPVFDGVAVINSKFTGVKYAGVLLGHTDSSLTYSNIIISNNVVTATDAQCGSLFGYAAGAIAASNIVICDNEITGAKTGALCGRANGSDQNFVNINVDQPDNALIGSYYDGSKSFTGEDTVANVNAIWMVSEGTTGSIAIKAGTWSVDPSVYVPEAGYKVIDNQDDTWTVEALTPIALTISAENATVTGIEAGTVYEGDELTFTVAANDGYKLVDVKANGAVLTDNDGTYTYEVTGQETGAALAIVVTVEEDAQPVDPEDPKSYDDDDQAKAAADAINANKEKMINTPEGATPARYTSLFTAVANGNVVTVELNEEGTNAVKTAAAAIETAVATKLANITAAEVGGVIELGDVTVEPGFWYGVAATDNLTGMKTVEPETWVQAKSTTLSGLTAKKPAADKGFFQTKAKASSK